jgi:hypothetical protein
MAIRGTPQQAAAKWQQRLSASTQEIQAGIDRVTEAPGRKAAAQKAAWLANIQAKADKWERNVGRVTLEQWRESAKAGVGRVAQGAQQKVGKVEAFQTEFFPFLERVQQKLASTPRGSLETNLARMVMNAREISNFKRGGGA